MVGKSTCGSGETGSWKKAKMPASTMPIVSRVVATGRAMKGAERLMRWAWKRKEVFFFEKKNQKTFAVAVADLSGGTHT